MCKVPVLIVGGDHHNTLAVIRCLGKEKIPLKVIVHKNNSDIKNIELRNSKYIKYIEVINETESALVECIEKNIELEKQVLFPCSDFSALVIDRNYNSFKNHFYFIGFLDNPGKMEYMMDKFNQKKWADRNSILMAKTWTMNIYQQGTNLPNNLVYPCIIKPKISAEGNKSDILICHNFNELISAIETYREKKYRNIIIQEYLFKKYEVCAFGTLVLDGKSYGGVVKKIRENPPWGGGSLTFAQYINDVQIESIIKNILSKLNKEGFVGMYDIELLICDDNIYLNEINFRHSGNGYSLIKNGIRAPYILYLNIIGSKIIVKDSLKNKNMYFIDELNEWDSYRKNYISLKEMIFDFFRANSYAKIDSNDIICSFTYVMEKFFRRIK